MDADEIHETDETNYDFKKRKAQARCSTQDQAIGNPQDLSVRVSVAPFNAVYRLSIHEVMLVLYLHPTPNVVTLPRIAG